MTLEACNVLALNGSLIMINISCMFVTVVCGSLAAPTGGTVTLYSDGRDTVAVNECVSGFTLQGHHNLTCIFIAVVCGGLAAPTGGTVTLYSDGRDTVAVYECVPGFTLQGHYNLTCTTDGTWDQQQPACGRKML